MRSKPAKMLMTAVAVAVVLPVTACGGGSQPPAKLSNGASSTGASAATTSAIASPTPATASSSTSASTAPSTSAAAGGLPDLTLPSDVTLQFNLPKTGDPAKDAALQGLVQAEEAKYKATETGLINGPLVDDFYIVDGPRMVEQYLVRKQQAGTTVTGTNVYYDWTFTGGSADHTAYQITYCEDQNKLLGKNRATGQAVPQSSGLAQILSFKVNMIVDKKDGRWKAGYYDWKSGDVTCQAAEGH